MAINSPLLEDISIQNAKGLLMNITGPSDMTMDEIDEASNYIRNEVSDEAEIFWGVVFDENMEDEIQITVIATGIDKDHYNKVVKLRDITPEEAQDPWTVKVNGENFDELDLPEVAVEAVAGIDRGRHLQQRRSVAGPGQVGEADDEQAATPDHRARDRQSLQRQCQSTSSAAWRPRRRTTVGGSAPRDRLVHAHLVAALQFDGVNPSTRSRTSSSSRSSSRASRSRSVVRW